jgi:hypothetical protein
MSEQIILIDYWFNYVSELQLNNAAETAFYAYPVLLLEFSGTELKAGATGSAQQNTSPSVAQERECVFYTAFFDILYPAYFTGLDVPYMTDTKSTAGPLHT